MRTALIIAHRVALVISGVSLAYLLFIFGHTETAPLSRVLLACTVAAVSALVAGILSWVGLPALPQDDTKKKGPRSSTPKRSH